MAIVGIVLCGGASRRMGRPKAWLDFAGEPLLCRVTRFVSRVVSPVIVVAGPNQSLPELPPDVVIARDPVEHRGPLVGLAAGLAAAPQGSSHAFVCACDMPFLTPELIKLFIACAQTNLLVVPVIDSQRLPLPALYPTLVEALIPERLRSGDNSLRSLMNSVDANEVTESNLRMIDADLLAFRSMNTRADYEAAIAHPGVGRGEQKPPTTSPTPG